MLSPMRRREFLITAGGALGAMLASPCKLARAQQRKPMPDVIVLLPGITGSVLRKDGKDLWAPSAEGIFGAIRSLGQNLQALRLRDDPPDLEDIGDGITADRMVRDVHLIPGLWKIDGYTKISEEISRTYAVEGRRNFFEFPYDWRRDNGVAARRLQRESHAWLKAWRESSGNKDAKLILVAHSMGGLVSRYFLECLEGWHDTRKLITFGTPYRGSLNAFNFLCNGYTKQLGPIRLSSLTELLRSFTSIYQLLPDYPCYDPGDSKLVLVGETKGIPNVDSGKASQALAFHRKIEKAVTEHRKDEAYTRKETRYLIHPVVGRFQHTLQSAKLVAGKVEFSAEFPGDVVDGDGTVPRQSAIPKELMGEGREFAFAEAHGSLQNNQAVLGQLDTILKEPKWDLYRGPGALAISLFLDDTYTTGEPVVIRARYQPAELKLSLRAVIEHAATRKTTTVKMQARKDGFHEAKLAPLPAGSYRVKVETGSDSVTDLILVSGKV